MRLFPLLLMGACVRPLPPYLAVDPPTTAQEAPTEVRSTEDLVALLLGGDPLARAVRLPPGVEAPDASAEPLLAYLHEVEVLERGATDFDVALARASRGARGTLAEPFDRGYRLGVVETALATPAGAPEAMETRIAAWLTPMAPGDPDNRLARRPLDWLTGPGDIREPLRNYAEDWVLRGWLVAPSIPLGPIAHDLEGPQYDGLRGSRAGRLITARAADAHGGATDEAIADLERATLLALIRVAADRDREQADWATRLTAEREALGSSDPIEHLLRRAFDRLLEDAGDDRAAGAALLASAALRWDGDCEQTSCVGLDRASDLAHAPVWSADLAWMARAWQVIALKGALDTMEVGHESVLFPKALVDLCDAVLGLGAGPLDGDLLRRRTPDPAIWLALGRAAGEDGIVDWAGARVALGQILRTAASAPELAEMPAEGRDSMDRIFRRAVP